MSGRPNTFPNKEGEIDANTIAVTGAYGYSGKYIAQALVNKGRRVITLTGSPERSNSFKGKVPAHPFNFDHPDRLIETLRGVGTLVNTYWVRFNHDTKTHEQAIHNTLILFQSALEAGVRRIVHISITNPTLGSPLPYFSGKAELENALEEMDISFAILRPAVIFGREDILINNIAWLLRRFPVFAIPGDGRYRLQPIYVGDLARIAADQVDGDENVILNATGPETYSFNQLVNLLKEVVDGKAYITHVSPKLAYRLSQLLGMLVGDVMLTEGEITGLMGGLLATDTPPTGETKLSDWARKHAATLGTFYANELRRHYN